MGRCPTITVDRTDGCQVYLSRESLAAQIVTSRSTEVNVLIPSGEDYVR